MVKLESVTRRYIGLSTDTKPVSPSDEVTPGSSFLESDTGKIYRWNGQEWLCPPADTEALEISRAMLLELGQIRELLQLTTS